MMNKIQVQTCFTLLEINVFIYYSRKGFLTLGKKIIKSKLILDLDIYHLKLIIHRNWKERSEF